MMFLELLLKSWPRSWRAAAALVALIVGGGLLLDGLQALVLPEDQTGGVRFIIGLAIVIPATVCFYQWQFLDGESKPYQGLETLNKHHEAKRREERIRSAAVTAVFSSHHGEHVPAAKPEPHANPTHDKPSV